MNRSEYHHSEVFQGSCCRVQQDAAISGLASDRSCRFPRRDLHFRRWARHAVICSCCSVAAQYDLLVLYMQKLLIPKCPDCQDQVCRMLRPFLHSPPRRLLALPSSVKLTSKFSRERSITQPGCRQLFLLTTVPTQSVIVHHAVLVRRWIADDTFGYVLDCSAEQYDSIMLDSIPVGEGASLVFCALTGGTCFLPLIVIGLCLINVQATKVQLQSICGSSQTPVATMEMSIHICCLQHHTQLRGFLLELIHIHQTLCSLCYHRYAYLHQVVSFHLKHMLCV